MNLDDLLLKDIGELDDKEKAYLKEHKEELEETEKETYKDIITEKEEKKEEDKGFSFKNQEELDNYLDRFVDAKLPKKEEDKKPDEDTVPDFFDKDYKPKDWNDYTKAVLPKIVDFISKNPKIKETVKEEITLTEKDREEQKKKINEEIDTEVANLRKAHADIPKGDSDEGKKWEKDLAQTFIDFPSLRSMDEAYRIMEMKKGTKEKEEEDKEDLAKKIGGGSGTGGETKTRKYSEIAGRSMDAAFEKALQSLEASS